MHLQRISRKRKEEIQNTHSEMLKRSANNKSKKVIKLVDPHN